ncbi:MAG: type IX secretion system membrane protein PorP/SprF [Cellulophaga sp.]|uniref:PorP/SprF family type IX secretion system membrane protein n=1 Tax=unclassified Cellulophaga TaxID=2634405 RepID=UPI0026E1E72A|nr:MULTISPECIES: type IX secretion system membrane protein PorP/SprF [unclassified Cellulophaga]MDO6490957.1 type IX secretion system membrane protein PorP/SprF [Cellulophaga sp. 2_MG-2023]MDO6493849.1 type IX secretion system membrane protein PorP/SprF [Cellulophaga sp. 3_MG-2023]
MKSQVSSSNKIYLLALICIVLGLQTVTAQEATVSENSSSNSYHNQMFFNRFLINPTFSLVRENKSYLNILHRNQYATFDDNVQNYFVGFSSKINDNAAFGIGIYSQWAGVVQEFGFNANYATAVQLGEKSMLTFGANVTYFNEGLDKNRIVADNNDLQLIDAKKESKLAIQPAITLSVGRFDVGIYAKDLVRYNQTTNAFSTNFNDKSVKASLQYTQPFNATRGLFAEARFMPLVQVGKNENGNISYIGSMLLDLPKYGWLQSTIDNEHGVSMGLGFNLNNKMSLGYLLEKDIMNNETDLGWNHELSLAYTFKNNGPAFATNDKQESQDRKVDNIIRNYEEQILALMEDQKRDKERIVALESGKDATRMAISSKKRENEILALITKQNSLKREQDNTPKSNTTNNSNINTYASTTNTPKNKVQDKFNSIVKNFESQSVTLNSKKKKDNRKNKRASKSRAVTEQTTVQTDVNSLAYENRLILDELILRQDSIENARSRDLEKKFESIVRILRNDIKQNLQTTAQEVNTVPNSAVAATTTKKVTYKLDADKKVAATTENKKFKKIPLKVVNQSDMDGVKSGFYVIANVYKTKKYLDAFMAKLKKENIDAKQFYNKENDLYYVYLADYSYMQDAEDAYASNLNGKYQDEKWILKVDKPTYSASTATASNIYED